MAFLRGFKTHIAVGLGLLTLILGVFTGDVALAEAFRQLGEKLPEIFGLLGISALREGIKTDTK